MLKNVTTSLVIGCAGLGMLTAAHAQDPSAITIEPGALEEALDALAQQTGIQLLYDLKQIEGLRTEGVSNALSAEAAAAELLKGTSLVIKTDPSGAILIAEPTQQSLRKIGAERTASHRGIRLAQSAIQPNESEGQDDSAPSGAANPSMWALEELIVTGSHIRGAQNLSSPVIGFDRQDIERSGYATTQDLVRSLPQNLSTVSDTTFGAANGGIDFGYGGSGVNLRGLGSESTLVLVNGRRLAAAGRGDFVDVSLIPLSAVERVEILTDGASAIYGSDAVGGVVNLILRKNFEGAETRLRYGAVSEGSHEELTAGQLLGHSWSSGQVLVSYEYFDRTALDAADRDFVRLTVFDSLDLIPQQSRHSLHSLLTQELTDGVELSGDLYYTRRESEFTHHHSYHVPLIILQKGEQYGGSLGLSVALSRGWELRASGVLSENRSDDSDKEKQTGLSSSGLANESRLWSFDLAADGPIADAPGGSIRLALGGQFRKDKFVEEYVWYPAQLDRDVAAGYAEIQVPLVGETNRRAGVTRLDLNVAARYENYSDFGSTFNPKIGVSWSPVAGLNVRSTWGTSFRAPLLSQMNAGNHDIVINELGYADVSGNSTGLYLVGNGPGLRPEESTNWTVGFDLAPAALPDLTVSATYFEIDYEHRLRTPFPPGYYHLDVLPDPAYAAVVERNPDPAKIAALLQSSTVTCFSPSWDPCATIPSIDAIVDGRLRNLANVHVSGLDLSVAYRWVTAIGDFGLQLSGAYQFENREQLVPTAPQTNQLNDVYRPVDLRMRNAMSFTRGRMNATAFINYTDDYRDNRHAFVMDRRPRVGSWTTVDLNVQYKLNHLLSLGGSSPATVSIAAVNVFDKDPPYVGHNFGIHFDGVNAIPLGRFLSAQIVVPWGAR